MAIPRLDVEIGCPVKAYYVQPPNKLLRLSLEDLSSARLFDPTHFSLHSRISLNSQNGDLNLVRYLSNFSTRYSKSTCYL
jgi:hypothetical protein